LIFSNIKLHIFLKNNFSGGIFASWVKMKDMTRSAAAEYKRIIKSHLLNIDDIMMFPVSRHEAVAFFNLV